MTDLSADITAIDFLRDPSVVADPYPYFAVPTFILRGLTTLHLEFTPAT